MATLSAKDGSITISGLSCTKFVGASGEGIFPPAGIEYNEFSCTPARNVPGILVFEIEGSSKYEYFYHYFWRDGKVIARFGVENLARPFSRSNGIFFVQIRDWYYVSELPRDTDRDYKLVGRFTILQYVAGAIDLKELDRCARAYPRKVKFQTSYLSLQWENARLKSEMKMRTEILSNIILGYRMSRSKAVVQMNNYWSMLGQLRDRVRANWLFGLLYGKKNRRTLEAALHNHVIFEASDSFDD
jgi:hypothetical protein